MFRWPLLRLVTLVAAGSLLTAACNAQEEPQVVDDEEEEIPGVEGVVQVEPSGSITLPPPEELDPDATLRYGFPTGFIQWDPDRTPAEAIDAVYMTMVYDALFRLQPDGIVGPMLATDWAFEDDGHILNIALREDVRFHDGSALDADVVVANLERRRSPDSALASGLENVTAVEADGPHTVRIGLSEPDPSILNVLATMAGYMVSPNGLTDPNLEQTPAGSGPYLLESARTDRTVYVRNPDYWDEDMFITARVEIVNIPDDDARNFALRTGEVDAIRLKNTHYNDALEMVEAGGFNFYTYTPFGSWAMLVNTTREPLDDVRVRRAISMSIDRDAINGALFDDRCVPSTQPFGEGLPGHVPALDEAIVYDPEGAAELLADAGVDEGFSINLLSATTPEAQNVAVALKDQLRPLGIDVNVVTAELRIPTLFSEGGHDTAIVTVSPTAPAIPTPGATINTLYLGPLMIGDPSPELKTLAAEAQREEPGTDDWTAAYENLSEHIVENPTHIIVCQETVTYAASSRVVGVDQMPNAILGAGIAHIRYLALRK